MNITLPKGYKADIKRLTEAGASHIKVELEAQLNRRRHSSPECRQCYRGRQNCNECYEGRDISAIGPEPEPRGWSWTDAEQEAYRTWRLALVEQPLCLGCYGAREIRCTQCRGRWQGQNNWNSTAYCHRFIKRQLSPEALAALTYSKFYNDGSVDSELTFTMPTGKAHLAVEVIEAFKALAIAMGSTLDVSNAGMHLSLLWYAKYPSQRKLRAEGMANFKAQVRKLLPALYAAGTHNGMTRGYGFRMPQVSNYDKYSAIYTHNDTCMEFRLFDTCYDRPEAILEKYQIMAQTIRYYTNPTAKVELTAKQFILELTRDRGQTAFKESLKDLDNLKAFDETIKYVVPTGTSLRKFKTARGVDVRRSDIAKVERDHVAEIRRTYRVNKRRDAIARQARLFEEMRFLVRTGNESLTELRQLATTRVSRATADSWQEYLRRSQREHRRYNNPYSINL